MGRPVNPPSLGDEAIIMYSHDIDLVLTEDEEDDHEADDPR